MKSRDRLFLMIVVAGLLLAACYLKVVAPERAKASALVAQVSTAQSAVSAAQSAAAGAQAAKSQYPAAYASLLNLGKAIPPESDVASLIYQINQASNSRGVSFDSISAGGAAGSPSPSSSSTSTATAGGFNTLPFTFQFTGSFFDLYHLMARLNQFTAQTTNGNVQVSGRLFTITGATLTGDQHSLTGTITANAYVLPSTSSSPTPGAPGAPAAPGAPTPGAPAAAAPPAAGTAPAVIHP